MSSDYIIRRLIKDDYYNGFIDLLGQLTIQKDIKYENFLELFNKMDSDKDISILVIELVNTKKIIGTGKCFIEHKFTHGISKVAHIEDVVIDNQFNGKGLGKQIINELINFAKSNNCYKVILNCNENNIKFYEKCGMKISDYQMRLDL